MLPPVSPTYCAFPGDDEGSGRIVRFDSECTLIPAESPQKPRSALTTKSYSLPLWRKSSATYSSEPSQLEGDYVLVAGERSAPTPAASSSSSKSHVLLTVSIPRFKSSSSKTILRRVPSTGDVIVKPCLVDRERPSRARIQQQRRPSLPTNLPTTTAHKHTTVPLRSCCTGCYSIVEQSSRDSYEVKLPSPREARFPGRSASDGESPREDFSRATVDVSFQHGIARSTRHCNANSNSNYPSASRDPSSSSALPELDASQSPFPSPQPSPLLQTPVGVKDDELFPLPSCTKIRTSPRSSPLLSPKSTPPGIDTSAPHSPRLRAPPSPQLLAAARPMMRRRS